MSFLPNSFVISADSHEAIRFVARAKGINPDLLAHDIITEWIAKNHGDVLDYIHKRNGAEDDFNKSLKTKLNPDPFDKK